MPETLEFRVRISSKRILEISEENEQLKVGFEEVVSRLGWQEIERKKLREDPYDNSFKTKIKIDPETEVTFTYDFVTMRYTGKMTGNDRALLQSEVERFIHNLQAVNNQYTYQIN